MHDGRGSSYILWELDVHQYDREAFVRGAGFAEVKLSIEGRPVAFLEAKRIGAIPASGERKRIELLPEERQAIRYARSKGVSWAILTNFERLIVFDADDQRPVLTFDQPQEILDRFDQLLWLSKEKIETSLRWWKGRQRVEPVDLGFLDQLEDWRLMLARDLYRHNRENPVLCDDTGTFGVDLLMRAVQRLLHRLIIIQFADDKEVLENHDVLRHVIERWEAAQRPYAEPVPLLSLLQPFRAFDRMHNTTIFSHTAYCDEIVVSDEVLRHIVEEIVGKNFRGFESDILGNTYESYLGHKLVFNEAKGDFEHVESREARREEGIYYTPPYIVRHMVDHTLGNYLKGKTVEDIRDLRVLDPACGSGSFLIYAFDVLADFYERENARIERLQVQTMEAYFEKHGGGLPLGERLSDLPQRYGIIPALFWSVISMGWTWTPRRRRSLP